MSFRKNVSLALDPEMRTQKGLSKTNLFIITLILVSIAITIFETEPLFTVGYEKYYQASHFAFFIVFLVEYVARLYAAPMNHKYRNPWHYAVSLSSLLDLFVLVSFLLPLLGMETTLLRMFRAARLVRLARLGRYSLALSLIYQAIASRRYELGFSVAIVGAMMLLASTALYVCERSVQPEAFGSIPRAMWWAIATLTTVGYGDVVPITPFGRFFAALTAISGIGIIAIPTAILAGAFSEAMQKAHDLKKDHLSGGS